MQKCFKILHWNTIVINIIRKYTIFYFDVIKITFVSLQIFQELSMKSFQMQKRQFKHHQCLLVSCKAKPLKQLKVIHM